ncbi:hypothetical protein C8J57DRAFT_1234998 [Mycena rebaudengoi]|nr:hypothetical protein C8J57DRAFT_1234998 [Mycena rebaudengoi]
MFEKISRLPQIFLIIALGFSGHFTGGQQRQTHRHHLLTLGQQSRIPAGPSRYCFSGVSVVPPVQRHICFSDGTFDVVVVVKWSSIWDSSSLIFPKSAPLKWRGIQNPAKMVPRGPSPEFSEWDRPLTSTGSRVYEIVDNAKTPKNAEKRRKRQCSVNKSHQNFCFGSFRPVRRTSRSEQLPFYVGNETTPSSESITTVLWFGPLNSPTIQLHWILVHSGNFSLHTAFKPTPSLLEAPLLLGQVCRQWREIALTAPDLWQSLSCEGCPPAELLQMWLSRSGNTPLKYSIVYTDPTIAETFFDSGLQHSHHREDVALRLPFTSFAHLDGRSLPMLRRIVLQMCGSVPDVRRDKIDIRDVPQLRALSQKFDEISGYLAALIQLIISTSFGNDVTSTPTQLLITLTSLESISVTFGPASILRHLTLPRLQMLTVTGGLNLQSAEILKSLLHRSCCNPHQLTMSLYGAPVEYPPHCT